MLKTIHCRISCVLALAAVAVFSVDVALARGGRGGGHRGGASHAGGHRGNAQHAPQSGAAGHGAQHHAPQHAGNQHQAGKKHVAAEHHAIGQHQQFRGGEHRDGDRRNDHYAGKYAGRNWNQHYGWRGRHYLGANNWWWGAVPLGYAADQPYGVPEYTEAPYDESADTADDSTDAYASADDEMSVEGEGSPEQLANNGPLPDNENEAEPLPGQADRAAIHVVLPSAKSAVDLNGHRVYGNGVDRVVMTPVIEPGSELRIELTATWDQGGEPRTQSRSRVLQTGDYVTIDFTQPLEEPVAR